MERNDLIRELTEIAEDRHGAKNTHLLSWLEKGYFHCQHGSEKWCQGDYLDSARAYIERLEAVAKDALTTIASLSEALAEAEKKGAEVERLRFESDLDKWVKTLGAGITGYQPEAYAVMDAACAELVKLRTEVETLRNPWSSDMSAMPRGQDVVVYQPPHKAGRTTLPARICEVRNAGYTRESTHWMLPTPPRDLSQGGQHG